MSKVFLYSEIVLIFALAILLLIVSPKLTVVSFIILFVFSFILNYLSKKKLSILGEKRNKTYSKINNALIEIFNSFREIKIYSKSSFYLNNYREQNNDFSITQKKIDFFSSITRYLFEIIVVFFLYLIFLLNINFINVSLIPTLGLFAFSFFRLYPSFTKISVLRTLLRTNQDSMRILYDIHKKNVSEEIFNKNNIKFESSLELKNVSFSYNNQRSILQNINLFIPKGKKIGISGKNGSGKTTLSNIILSLIKPLNGEMLIDSKINVFDNLYGYRNMISFIPQNIFLLNDTVEKNITFNQDYLDREKLNKVLVITQLEELIFDLKKRGKITIGENGNNLSGGQRQRIAIARAIYRDSEIVIMDEHTNSLDFKMEKEFIASSKEIFNNKTLIIVSHKKEMLDFCDDVYMLEDGKLNKF
jgi:ATP-binding cassette subfamily C protein